MKIEQIYTGCLAQGAYYIESKGEVAIIDPLREVQPYLDKATLDNAKIKYIFETHFHADFVSGHLTLAEKTGAKIVFGPTATPEYDVLVAEDNQVFRLGDVQIKVLHTPGHTMESTTYLLIDEAGKDHAIFSGDTLFLGDVGRPDLAQKAGELSDRDLAGMLFDSLRNKIMTLSDDVIVYPGHGAGSACGKNMSKETIGSIGHEKATNYALRVDMSKEEFCDAVLDGLVAPPAYFPMNVQMNKGGYASIDKVIEKGSNALTPESLELLAESTDAIILDVRHEKDFVKGFIPQSIFIGLDGSFAPWVGALIKDVKQEIILVAPEGRLEEAITRLSRVGFDQIIGYLKGGFEAWKAAGKEVDTIESMDAQRFESNVKEENKVFDVRKSSEFGSEHLLNAENTPLDNLNDFMSAFPAEGMNYVHCAGGYRSVIAISILKSRGIHNLVNVEGGFNAIKNTKLPVTDYVCPTTLF